MVSVVTKRTAEAHLRLAEGFIKSTEVGDTSSEGEIRNAFSRAYYALFHACYAHVLASGMELRKAEERRIDHGRLQSSMRRLAGEAFGRFVEEAYDRRRRADYDPGWPVPPATGAQGELGRAKTQFYWLVRTARRILA
jgi:uncharacterized protein (UPF0332 family)